MREVAEELGTEIIDLSQFGVGENLFTFDGEPGHEIVFVYDAQFADRKRYKIEEMHGMEGGVEFTAHWIDPFAPEGRPSPLPRRAA